MSEEKTIYNLDLHESMTIRQIPIDNRAKNYEWEVIRVPSGWIYQCADLRLASSQFFVPFDNSFQTK